MIITSITTSQRAKFGYGRVNLKTSLATFAALRVKPQFTRDSAITSGKRSTNSMVQFPVSANPSINGNMFHDHATHDNGTIFMLQAQWKRGGSPIRDGCILLRLRQEAAMLNVVARLPTGMESQLGDSFSIFTGYADILSVEEAAVHRIIIPPRFVDMFFDPEQVDECFTIQELARERAAKPEMALVSTSQGVVLKEVATAPVRRMKFRKQGE
jgi:hypothetical protein